MSAQPEGSPAPWLADPERASMLWLRVMRWIAVAAGRRTARLVLHPITLYFMLVGGKPRRESRRYLTRALGRPARWIDSYRHIHHFAATVLDRVYLLRENFEAFEFTDAGVKRVTDRLDRGEGAFMIGAHLGSFEALRSLGEERGRRVAMVMYEDNARLINATLAAIAPKATMRTIALGHVGAMLQLREWLAEGGIAGLLADRTLPGQGARAKTLWLPFLGQPAPFSDGPFRLAALMRRPVVFMAGLYHGRGRYELRFVPLADFSQVSAAGLEADIQDALRGYVELLESICRETPYNWFNFFDFWAGDAGPPGHDHAPPDTIRS